MKALLLVVGTAGAAAGAPYVLDVFQVTLLTRGLVWAILGLSVFFLLRSLNLPSFGHAAYFGVGAYVAGLAVTRWEMHNIWVCLAVGIAITCVVALPVALITPRLGTIGFLLVTLAVAEMLRSVALRWRLLGGSDGLVGVTRPGAGPVPVSLTDPVNYYYLTVAVTAVCVLVLWAVRRSAVGGVLVGIRESEDRMRALGYRVGAYKVFAVVLSAAVAASAGVLHAYLIRYVSPEDLSALVSARSLIIVVISAGMLWAPVWVAVSLAFVEDVISSRTDSWQALMGLLYIGVALLGAAGGLGPVKRLVRRRAAFRRTAPGQLVEPSVEVAIGQEKQ